METQALTVRDEQAIAPVSDAPQSAPGVTPAQAKVDAIAKLTMDAYQRASQLNLTDEEINALMAEFPDEAFKTGAAGKENLIYIEHAYLRDRLNSVFRPGQWAIVPRNRWAEDFHTSSGKDAVRVYVEAMLCIRGCFAAEAVGEMEYYPNNAAQNYGDAVEGAKTAALRRCCKELGIGLQAWKKDWCAEWWQRRKGGSRPNPAPRPAPSKPDPVAEPAKPAGATDKTRAWMIEKLQAGETGQNRETVDQFFRAAGAIGTGQSIEVLPLQYVPKTKEELQELITAIGDFDGGERAEIPYLRKAPPAPPPPPPKDIQGQHIAGIIDKVTKKNGAKKNGEKWTLYGIKIGDQWFNTFSSTVGEKAQANHGKEVTLTYEEGEKGNTALEIIVADDDDFYEQH